MRRNLMVFLAGWYLAYWALAWGLGLAIGWIWSIPVALLTVTAALVFYVRHTGFEPGEAFCFIWRRKYRVRHIHYPRSGYTTCERVREMFQEDA